MPFQRVLRTTTIATRTALAGAMLLSAAPASAAGLVSITASAGLDGVVKADRWTPVRIAVTSKDSDLSAQLLVSWGDARLRRDVSLPSPGTRTFELYVRTSEAASSMHVTLRSGSSELASVDAPVRVFPAGDVVTVCVTTAVAGPTTGCSAVVSPDALPLSPRGYEVADRVVWPGEDGTHDSARSPASLPRNQRTALEEWRALRRLDASGDLSLAPQATRPSVPAGLPSRIGTAIAIGAATYVFCLLLGGMLFASRGAGRAYAALALTTAAGMGAALVIGRAGPGRSLEVRHTSVLQQIPGAGSVLTIRGIAEFPAFASYALTLPASDAALEATTHSGRAEQLLNEDGHPVLAGTFGLGARQAFLAEVVTDVQPIAVTIDGSSAAVANQSDRPLVDCRSGNGTPTGQAGVLQPGASVTLALSRDSVGPLLTCTMPELPIAFRDPLRTVDSTGPTVVAAFHPSRAGPGTPVGAP